MSDESLRALERAWLASPEDATLLPLLAACARAGCDPSWAALAASPRWRPFVQLLREWLARPLEPQDGLEPAGLDTTDANDIPLPRALREWHLLAGARDDLVGEHFQRVPGERLGQEGGWLGDWLAVVRDQVGLLEWGLRPRRKPPEEDPPIYVIPLGVASPMRALDLRVSELPGALFLAEIPRRRGGLAPGVVVQVHDLPAGTSWRKLLRERYRALPLLEADGTRGQAWGDGETLIVPQQLVDYAWIWTRTPQAQARLVALLGEPLGQYSGERPADFPW